MLWYALRRENTPGYLTVNIFEDFQPTSHDTSTSRTEGRTDGQRCHSNTALCVASCGKKTFEIDETSTAHADVHG